MLCLFLAAQRFQGRARVHRFLGGWVEGGVEGIGSRSGRQERGGGGRGAEVVVLRRTDNGSASGVRVWVGRQ